MINYTERTVSLRGKTEPIREFEVWFRTPSGLFVTLDEAREHCAALDLDLAFNIAPVTVAVCDDGCYEEIPK